MTSEKSGLTIRNLPDSDLLDVLSQLRLLDLLQRLLGRGGGLGHVLPEGILHQVHLLFGLFGLPQQAGVTTWEEQQNRVVSRGSFCPRICPRRRSKTAIFTGEDDENEDQQELHGSAAEVGGTQSVWASTQHLPQRVTALLPEVASLSVWGAGAELWSALRSSGVFIPQAGVKGPHGGVKSSRRCRAVVSASTSQHQDDPPPHPTSPHLTPPHPTNTVKPLIKLPSSLTLLS